VRVEEARVKNRDEGRVVILGQEEVDGEDGSVSI
jgi:hypothetical protein